jgi:hypothetical protein
MQQYRYHLVCVAYLLHQCLYYHKPDTILPTTCATIHLFVHSKIPLQNIAKCLIIFAHAGFIDMISTVLSTEQ